MPKPAGKPVLKLIKLFRMSSTSLYSFDTVVWKGLKKITRLIEKKVNRKWAGIFNTACLKENILPGYLKNKFRRSPNSQPNSHSLVSTTIQEELNCADKDFQKLSVIVESEVLQLTKHLPSNTKEQVC